MRQYNKTLCKNGQTANRQRDQTKNLNLTNKPDLTQTEHRELLAVEWHNINWTEVYET